MLLKISWGINLFYILINKLDHRGIKKNKLPEDLLMKFEKQSKYATGRNKISQCLLKLIFY